MCLNPVSCLVTSMIVVDQLLMKYDYIGALYLLSGEHLTGAK